MEPWVVTLIAAAMAASPGVLALFRGWRKDRAEATRSLVASSTDLVDRLETRLDKVDKKLEEQDETITSQDEKIESQNKQIAKQNEQIVMLSAKVSVLESEREIMLRGIEKLCQQAREGGQGPVWEPEVDEDGRIIG